MANIDERRDERRNADPGAVNVMSVNDLLSMLTPDKKELTLDQKEDELVENRYNIFIHNLEYLLQKKNLAQARLCEDLLDCRPQPPQIAAYKKIGKDIPYRTIARIAIAFGYTPEVMTSQLLDQVDANGFAINKTPPRPVEEYRKYLGTYSMAYFATDAKLGGNKRSTARAMANGVMSIFFGSASDGIPSLDVLAFTNCTDEEQDELISSVRDAERRGNSRAIRQSYENVAMVKKPGTNDMPRMKCFYEGHMTLTDRIAEVTLSQVKGSDVIHFYLHNRAANSSEGSEYKGGLATMMSTSRGEEHMPCIQAIALSKRGFIIAKEELAKYLFLEPPKINLQEETKAIVAYMKALFPGEDADNPLSQLADSDKAFILESYIEKKLTEVIKRNVLGYYKVSTEMDSDLYKAVCRDQ